ncbi:MAG: hypothetical protein IJF54_00365 [Clostridia bacterium]|nr:hypothetical protein [Clostridia bacterium]
MQIFLIFCSITAVLICAAFSIFSKANASSKFCAVFYSVIYGVYLLLCMPIFNALLEQFQVDAPYLHIFMWICTAVSFIAPILTFVSLLVKNSRVNNIMFNSFFFLLTAAYIGLVVNGLFSDTDYIFVLVFLPLHYLLSLTLAASTLQDISVKTQKIKLLITYSLLALGCCLGIAGIIATSVSTGIINGSFFVIVGIFLLIAFTGIVSSALQLNKNKSK